MTNGWRNRATWLVNLWFNPETVNDIDFLEETLEDEFLTIIETATGSTSNFYVDLIDFTVIDWDELRNAMTNEEE